MMELAAVAIAALICGSLWNDKTMMSSEGNEATAERKEEEEY